MITATDISLITTAPKIMINCMIIRMTMLMVTGITTATATITPVLAQATSTRTRPAARRGRRKG